MKASSLYFVLGTAQVAICAPTSRYSAGGMDKVAGTEHGVATPPRVLSTLDSQNDAPEPDWRDSAPPHPRYRDILPPLSKHRIPEAGSQGAPKIDVIRVVPDPVHDENDVLGRLEAGTTGMSDTERNNMLIVFLAIVFFVMVVVMETCGNVFRR